MTDFFKDIPEITYQGPSSDSDYAYRHYDPSEVVGGKTMADNLRFAVAYWHSFACARKAIASCNRARVWKR